MLQNASGPTSSKPLKAAEGAPSEKGEGLRLYQKLILARRAEERVCEEYPGDEMKTPVHLGVGQEAIPVGVCSVIPPGTRTFGTYRNHALYLSVTDDVDGFFGELFGRATGPGKGKAGSMHLAYPERGLVATSAVVGTTIPLAVGAALANAYRKSPDGVVAFFGDGAVEEGAFWESLNFACLRRLRILFVCEDNGLAIHTATSQRQGFRSIPEAVRGFECHVDSRDGSDLTTVITSTKQMLERMERDPRPGFLHFTYFRFLEHVGPREDFEAGYRRRPTPEEMERLDPVSRFEKTLCRNGCAPADLQRVRSEVQGRIDRAVQRARTAAFAPPAELYTDVFAETQPVAGKSGSEAPKSQISFRQALSLAMRREMESDPEVFIFGLDVPDHKRIFGSTAGLVEQFGPERCFGTPLSEEGMTGAALGAAISGLRPVHVHIRADFVLLAMNQIVNMVSNLHYMTGGRLRVPLVIRAVIGRGWGQSAQHSKTLHGILSHFPGLKVVMPSTPQDAYSLLRSSVRDDNPVVFLEHRWLYDVVGEVDEGKAVPLGLPAVRRKGGALTVISTSWMTVEALKAAEVLSRKQGVELEVVDVRTISPLDVEPMVESVRKTRHCIVADYDWAFSGFSAELAAQIGHRCFGLLKKPVERLGFAHVPCPTTRPLENLFYPSAVNIIQTAEKMLGLRETDLSGEIFYSYERNFKGPF